MPYSPLEGFEIGQKIGKAKRSTAGMASDTLLEQFNKSSESNREIGKLLAVERFKTALSSPKESAETELAREKASYFKKLASGDIGGGVSEGDFVVDRYGPGGPTLVNAKARLQQKQMEAQSKELPKLQRAYDAVTSLRNQYEKSMSPVSVPSGSNPILGAMQKSMQGLEKGFAAKSGSNPELNRYLANRSGFTSLISKGGFMEAGVLTEQDIQRILNILPNEYSTKEEADIAWNEVTSILNQAQSRFEEMGGGVPRADKASDASNTSNVPDEKSIYERLATRYGRTR